MALTGRRDLFCREYIKDLNARQAAIRAGYHDPDSEGARLLADPDVQAHIAELHKGRNEKLEFDAVEVVRELWRLLNTDLAQAINDDGTVKAVVDIPFDCRRAIASVKVEETFTGRGEEREWSGYIKEIKFWNKERAIEMLCRHLSLFNDKLKVDGLEDVAKAILEARGRAVPII